MVRRPRINRIPPHAATLGPEACALARQAGLVADGWQQESVAAILAVRSDRRWACQVYAEFVARQNGKGSILEIRVLFGFLVLGEHEIVWTAHLFNTAVKAFVRLKALFKALGRQVNEKDDELWAVTIPGLRREVLVKFTNTNGLQSITRLDTQAKIEFLARSSGGGRGFTGDVLIVDEAFALTDEQLAALLPTLSARSMEQPGPQIIYMSSPPLKSEPDKVVFRIKKRSESDKPGRLGFRDWGLAGDLENLGEVDFYDRALWWATNPALGLRISEEWIEETELGQMSELDFARERLGIWPPYPSDTEDIIDFAVWKKLLDEESRLGTDFAYAVDITPDRRWGAIGVYGPRSDGLGHVEVIEHREGTAWIVPRLAELVAKWNPVAVALDVKGPAGSLLLALKDVGISLPEKEADGKSIKPRRGDLFIPTANEYAGSCGGLVDEIGQGKLRHLGQVPLNAAVGGVAPRPLGDSYAWGRKKSSANIAPLVAVTLARLAYLARINVLAAPAAPPATAAVPEHTGGIAGGTELWRPTSRLNI